ncbi:MAG: hypothetical protein E7464_04215 [Ruminococcaceae bacterium]|nr:hypothetical protein [Oscillospiraceae bacterium]
MKITEIEKKIEQGYFSEPLFIEFQAALKRVPKRMRCQHCYTSAYYLKDKRPKDGIRLIQFGLETFESDWVDKMRAYQTLGRIYESCQDYEAAKPAYEKALAVIPDEQKDAYTPNLSMDILQAELHCANFKYTDYISQLYQETKKADSFSSEFRRFRFYRAITEMVIAQKDGNSTKKKEAYRAATLALDGDKLTGMDLLLRRHKYKDDAHATKQALTFLKRNARIAK